MVLAVKDVLAESVKSRTAFHAKYRNQWLAVLSTHIITFVHGVAIGWLSPILINLQDSEKTPLSFTLSINDASWLGACWGIGALFGNLLIGFVCAKFGRKMTMISIAIPILISWWLIYFAQNVWFLYCSRTLAGFCGGAIFQILPLFASEIADNCVRGAMSTLLVCIWSGGILGGYIISSHLDYFLIPWIASIFPIAFMIAMSFFPETPNYFLTNGKLTEAERSFRFYKRIQSNNDPDLQNFEALKQYVTSNDTQTNVPWSQFFTKKVLKLFIVPLTATICCHVTGGFGLTQYMSAILENSGTQLDVNSCTMVLGVVQIFGSLFSVTFVDKLGRRCLMLTSMLGMGMGWIVFGCYLQFTTLQIRIELSWPTLAFMIFILAMGVIGLMSLFTIVVLEAFPSNLRARGFMLTFTVANIILIAQLKVYYLEIVYLGMASTSFLAGFFAIVGFLITYFMMEDKTSKEINYE